jgi:hypothetical protein
MTTAYIKFQAQTNKIKAKDCTSALPEDVSQTIPMSGQYEGKATNLMVLTGTTADIDNWLSLNPSKVEKISEAEATAIGQSMSPADVIRESLEVDGIITRSMSGEFDIVTGQTWTPLTYIYLHIDMVDGDGKEPIGIKNDGIDYMTVTATFRATDNPASPVISAINEEWRVLIRDNNNAIYDVVLIVFTEGIAEFAYKTTNRPAVCTMLESDLELVTLGEDIYKLKLASDARFTIYRTL